LHVTSVVELHVTSVVEQVRRRHRACWAVGTRHAHVGRLRRAGAGAR